MATIPLDVRKGMDVVDSTGEKIGEVEDVKFGDDEAVSTEGSQQQSGNGLVKQFVDAIWPDDMPEAERAQLQRAGYVLLDADGMMHRDRYIQPHQIAGVSGDTVNLSVKRDDLMRA